MTPDYLKFTLESSLSMGMFDEAAKRLKYTPFDDKTFQWRLVYEPTPMFLALRRLLCEGGYRYTMHLGGTAPVEGAVAVLTPWTEYCRPGVVSVRGLTIAKGVLPLYYEAGDWGCPQQNFLFDWSVEQAWAFLIDRNITTVEEVCAW